MKLLFSVDTLDEKFALDAIARAMSELAASSKAPAGIGMHA